MIDHQTAIDRITSLGLFKNVGGAAKGAALMDGKLPLGDGPEAYVIPMADSPGQAHGQASPVQMMSCHFGVALMVRISGDAGGASGLAKIEQLQRDLRKGMMGWTPAPGFSPLILGGGRLLDFQPQALWWLEEFISNCGLAAEES
jgi:hypothetical protein